MDKRSKEVKENGLKILKLVLDMMSETEKRLAKVVDEREVMLANLERMRHEGGARVKERMAREAGKIEFDAVMKEQAQKIKRIVRKLEEQSLTILEYEVKRLEGEIRRLKKRQHG